MRKKLVHIACNLYRFARDIMNEKQKNTSLNRNMLPSLQVQKFNLFFNLFMPQNTQLIKN